MARAKITSLGVVTLLLLLAISDRVVARHRPTFTDVAPVKNHDQDDEVEKVGTVDEDDCGGEDECLMRRTLEAHLDYIYTQKQKQP